MFVISDSDGRITTTYIGQPGQTVEDMTEFYGDQGFIFTELSPDLQNFWVNAGTVESKSELNATWDSETVTADGTSEIVLSNLPVPCTVIIDNENSVIVEDGSLEFSADIAGSYSIVVDEPAYLKKEWTVNAV